MKVECPKCKNSKFSISENRINKTAEIDFEKGTGLIVRDLSCDFCGTVFLANMNIEVSSVDIDFVVS